ncbi:LysR family transcriptional regulator [Providencia rettgeri]|uniref:LysR family transcriptional regulator n=1 Tax=Providencia TaxID=586 RepID=UPI00065DE908|nr:LysR family transcriptional regulator [Providencia rettgeri]ELR5177152.1 LysR family transcriptional regulator [Providencia rettgeri]ELR5261678.1 LysR family transcriptional regulator [Providencia rettgeri]
MSFNSDNLIIFLTVLDKGSFSAAARSLQRVPSAVSMAIANLEAELGFELFDRHSREPKPTEKALSLAPYARHIIENLSQLNTFSRELTQGVESTLAIGVAAGINSNILFDALRVLSQRYPLLHIELVTAPQDDLLPLLHKKQLQLAIVFGGIHVNSQEQFHYIGEESIIATISTKHPSLQERTSLYIEDLVESRQIIIGSRQHELSDMRIVVSSNYWKTDSFSLALGLVEGGMGWGNFPLSLIKDKLATGTLKPLQFKNTPNGLKLPIHVVSLKSHALKRGAQECIELLKKHILHKNFHDPF